MIHAFAGICNRIHMKFPKKFTIPYDFLQIGNVTILSYKTVPSPGYQMFSLIPAMRVIPYPPIVIVEKIPYNTNIFRN